MKLKSIFLLPLAALSLMAASCASGGNSARAAAGGNGSAAPAESLPVMMKPAPRPSSGAAVMPKAVLYKTSGDYLANVPVQLNDDGTLLSYPSPSDIPAGERPVVLAQGWILNPVGVSSRSVFTRWSYDAYRALPQAPSPAEVLDSVIPDSKVVATLQAPVTLREALADTAAVNRFILSRTCP